MPNVLLPQNRRYPSVMAINEDDNKIEAGDSMRLLSLAAITALIALMVATAWWLT